MSKDTVAVMMLYARPVVTRRRMSSLKGRISTWRLGMPYQASRSFGEWLSGLKDKVPVQSTAQDGILPQSLSEA